MSVSPANDQSSTTDAGCDCLQQINQALDEQGSNTVVGDSLIFSRTTGKERVVEIATYKRDPKNREKKRGMIPTFCPFCGRRYVSETDGAS
jgi:hypothetical protein